MSSPRSTVKRISRNLKANLEFRLRFLFDFYGMRQLQNLRASGRAACPHAAAARWDTAPYLKGEKAMHALEDRWDEMLAAGLDASLKAEQDKLRARMHDISEFMKLFKEMFDRAYKREREYCGSIWSGRFASTLVQGGEHLARCKRYVVYNPVRAGIVAQAREYRWSWCEEGVAPAAGGDWCLRRVVQIGAGVVFGDEAFVLATAFALGDRFHSGGAGAHPAGDVGWSTHGWRLAAAARRISCRNKAQARQK